jgi:hypothetical protein
VSRFVSRHGGITSWHSFSAGAHYDPDNVAFGPIIGLDEHEVAPGAGFDWHGHRGVHIVSRVLEGALRHEDSSGAVRLLGAGEFLVQSTGDGVRHLETNASDTEPLRFLQLTVLGSDGAPDVRQGPGPIDVAGCRIEMCSGLPNHVPCYVFVVGSGDDLRITEPVDVPSVDSELLVVELPGATTENRQ